MPILAETMVVKKFKSFHDYVKKNDHPDWPKAAWH